MKTNHEIVIANGFMTQNHGIIGWKSPINDLKKMVSKITPIELTKTTTYLVSKSYDVID